MQILGRTHMKNIVAGIVAHVDSGKTTLSEAMLYRSGRIRSLGRVDHGDTYLDTDSQEKDRGITIYSKQADLSYGDLHMTLLDTPGHVDFGTEMERVLPVLDYAVLVINGMDGVQSHTETLWGLLEKYEVPVFIFVNKMDMTRLSGAGLMENIRARLGNSCVDFGAEDAAEGIAASTMDMLDKYLETGANDEEDIRSAIAGRQLFPCFFGSALKGDGVDELLGALDRYMQERQYGDEFGARVYKISRDEKGERLTHMRIVGGELRLKDVLTLDDGHGHVTREKINQIRIYSGARYETALSVAAGGVCVVAGLENTYVRQGIGACENGVAPTLEPVLTYKVLYPDDVDALTMAEKLRQIGEEDPELSVQWDETAGEIFISVMGQVQLEVLARLVSDRYGIAITYGQGRIAYKETIAAPVMGVGHFEPLRHYAEAHVMLEPLERGSGLEFDSICSDDVLAKNWQRLILTHLQERSFRGALTGSPITDIRFTVTTGRAHTKHTEGGDFRQATYRAVRQGLMMAESVLLEPMYSFRIEVPHEFAGRVLSDIVRLCGHMDGQEIDGETTVITGRAPVATMREYYNELTAFSRGLGRLKVTVDGYEPCHNPEEVIAEIGYEPERDKGQPASSVFCAHGAGYIVDWYDVYDMMHVREDRGFELTGQSAYLTEETEETPSGRHSISVSDMSISDDELNEIFARTFGGVYKEAKAATGWFRRTSYQGDTTGDGQGRKASGDVRRAKPADVGVGRSGAFKKKQIGEAHVIVDGYNVIFAWDELAELAHDNLAAARGKLMDVLSNYQGYERCKLTVVFDGYKVKDNAGTKLRYDDIDVIFTKEGETADACIERLTHELARKHKVTVVTSDGLEQIVTMGQGAIRMSSRDFRAEVERINEYLRDNYLK